MQVSDSVSECLNLMSSETISPIKESIYPKTWVGYKGQKFLLDHSQFSGTI